MKRTNSAELINLLTIDEKISLLSGKDFWQTVEIPRLEIPSMYLADGPHGVRRQAADAQRIGLNRGIPATCFPTEATVANSWNPDLGERVGAFLALEALSQGVHVILGPGINMKRNPLCGRNFEYFSEDPYLAGKMAAAYVRGIQSQGVAACVKHFAVSNQEWRVMSIDAVLDERSLREIYLTAFEIAVKEGGAKALMSAYNRVNGVHANENQHLMQEILREQWGFTGCVISNWGGSNDRIAGLKAGNELEMPGRQEEARREMLAALENGELTEAQIDENAVRLLDLILSTAGSAQAPKADFNIALHHRISQRVAEESIVLLKNENDILPLPFGKKVAVIGDFARNPRYQGAGSSLVNPTVLDNTLDCFDESGITSIGYEQGFHRYGRPSKSLQRRACELAAKADIVLLYLGLDENSEAQGIDREEMGLPQNQVELLYALSRVNENIVVVLSCGSAVEMPWIASVKGLLHAYLSGQAGARAILRVISGDVNPSGKLAETIPLSYADSPTSSYFPGKELTSEYLEGPFIGYRYFDQADVAPLFPFGFGLSYTSFSYSDPSIEGDTLSFTLENTGSMPGMEVAQLYVSLPGSGIIRAKKELKGFSKVMINPGEKKRVRFQFDHMTFRYFNTQSDSWEEEGGEYVLSIGSSSRDIHLECRFQRDGSGAGLPELWTTENLPFYRPGGPCKASEAGFARLIGRSLPPSRRPRNKPLGYEDPLSQCRCSPSWLARLAYWTMHGSYYLLRKFGRKDLANLIMMSMYHLPFRGISRMTGGRISSRMVDGILLAANGKTLSGAFSMAKAWSRMLRTERKSE